MGFGGNMNNRDGVSQAIVALFDSEMFYAEVIANMRRVSNPHIPVAGVCIKDHVELHINLPVFEAYSLKERTAILKHECEHILRNHIVRMREMAPDVYRKDSDEIDSIINGAKHKVMNIAADCAVNSHVRGLPENCILPKLFELEDGQTVEWYLENLKDNEKLKRLTRYDDHSLWYESDGNKDILKEKIRQAVNKAAERTRAAGRMTNNDELLVSELNKSVVNWKEQLRRFVARTIESRLESSKKKRNRRYGVMFPGSVKVDDLHIGVAIDTSGSVSDAALTQFLSEIRAISNYAKVTVVEADNEVKDAYQYDPRKKYTVKGRGGTAYQPAFNYFTEKTNVDAVIYFGDMDTADSVIKPKFQVLWAIVGESEPPADFGSQIRIVCSNI
jgi:predicted metal-dependent peptidase